MTKSLENSLGQGGTPVLCLKETVPYYLGKLQEGKSPSQVAAMRIKFRTGVRMAGLRPSNNRGSPDLAPGQGRGRWLPLRERHIKEEKSLEEPAKEEDPIR